MIEVVEHKSSLHGKQGIAKCFSDFSSALLLPEQPFYIAFIKYFETMKCVSTSRKSLSFDIDTDVTKF
jgi:hypothetical protein